MNFPLVHSFFAAFDFLQYSFNQRFQSIELLIINGTPPNLIRVAIKQLHSCCL